MRRRATLDTRELTLCALCGKPGRIEMNHVGGRQHLALFLMPFCIECHNRFHAVLRTYGVDLEFTADNVERIRRALAAIKIGEWMLLEQLKTQNSVEASNERP
jgi:hypothetical protein